MAAYRARCVSAGPWLAALALLVLCLPGLVAAEATQKELDVKAACLLNFARFIDWPPVPTSGEAADLVIGVLGDDPYGPILDAMVRGETVAGRHIAIHRSQHVLDLRDCQMIYISSSEKARIAGILHDLGQLPILTVSDIDGFCHAGGIIQFTRVGSKIRFMINDTVARRELLQISAQLLSVGQIFSEDPGGASGAQKPGLARDPP